MEQRKLHDILHLLDAVRTIDETMTVQQLQVLIRVATEPGLGVRGMMQRVNQTQSSASRNLRLLSDFATPLKPGMGLVELRQDTTDFRSRGAYLSPLGEEAVRRILASMVG